MELIYKLIEVMQYGSVALIGQQGPDIPCISVLMSPGRN